MAAECSCQCECATRPIQADNEWVEISTLILGAGLFILALVLPISFAWHLAILISAYLLTGWEVLYQAGRNILHGHLFDETFLMSLATLGALVLGEYPEAVAVMLFYQIGERLQKATVRRSRRSITALLDLRPDTAHVLMNDEIVNVRPDQVRVGDSILVQPGERIPLDGVIQKGHAALNMSALTGESLPREVGPGDEILSGSMNTNGVLTIQVTKPFSESTVSRILDLTQNALARKTKTERFITRFAHVYTPCVVAFAVLLAVVPPLLFHALWSEWLHRSLVFLVISCPCALVVSIPLTYFAGIGNASRQGILVKGSTALDALCRTDTVVFDKTGTLTHGRFSVARIRPTSNWTESDLLDLAAHSEIYSTHPIAQSIRQAYGDELCPDRVLSIEETAGHGICAQIDGRTIHLGSIGFLYTAGIAEVQDRNATVYLAVDGEYAGSITLTDTIKPEAMQAISALRTIGVRKIAMLTGDQTETAATVSQTLQLDDTFAELLPHQKVEQLERINQDIPKRGVLVFVGDGINDAPVLARSDVGIAMGGVGSDAALEAADVVLMTDDLNKVATSLSIAKRTHRIVVENIVLALGIKALLMLLGALGVANLWSAVFGDVGVTLLAILNALRAMRR